MINLAGLPQGKETFFYNSNLVLQSQLNEEQSSALLAVTCYATIRGTVLVLYENITSGASTIREYDLNSRTVIKTLNTALTLGERGGRHCLAELPNENILTVNRSTHDVIELDKDDLSVVTTYSLNINPYDASLYSDGDTLYYVDGNIVKTFSLGSDSPIGDFYDFGTPIRWPIISDSVFLYVYAGTFRAMDGDFLVTDGASIINTYTGFDFTGGGPLGFTYISELDRIYVYGAAPATIGETFSIVRFELSTGTLLDTTIVGGPRGSIFPYANTTGALVSTPVPTVTDMTIDCATNMVTVSGFLFPATPVVQMKKNSETFTDFTVESSSPSEIILHLPNFENANYGVNVS